jgi:uncharacterized protein YndB with AHSA1/START domain
MAHVPPYDIELWRVFDAPRDRVYWAFTVPDPFAQWHRPAGFPARLETVQIEPRVGVAAIRDGQ